MLFSKLREPWRTEKTKNDDDGDEEDDDNADADDDYSEAGRASSRNRCTSRGTRR